MPSSVTFICPSSATELTASSRQEGLCEWHGKSLGEHDYIAVPGGQRCTKCKHEIPDKPAQEGDVRSMVQQGWKLVPFEPTEEMLEAAMQREDDEPLSDWGKIVRAPHKDIYKAMIAALPEPPHED